MMLLMIAFFQLLLHPFHVSVSDIKYKSDQKAIQISSRIFLDDLELALRAHSGNETLDIVQRENWGFVNEQLESYLQEHLKLWDEKGKPYNLVFVGAEMEKDVLWAYLEVVKVRKLKQVTVHNSLLHEVWGDQENLVHFRAFDDVQSARLYKGEEREVFDWE